MRGKNRNWVPIVIACLLYLKPGLAPALPQKIRPRVLQSYPHDQRAYTQGLLFYQGKFYESTGLKGRSSLRRVEPTTGVVEKQLDLLGSLFGEGLERVGDELYQLTWQNNLAFVYDLHTFEQKRQLIYSGEGWGLCSDGQALIMSNGSANLTFRDSITFQPLREIGVTNQGVPEPNLNELECVGALVYANVYQTNRILRIRKSDGQVLTEIDASQLLTADDLVGTDVLNGIAYNPATQHFFLTGKLWPKVFEVAFDFNPSDEGPSDAGPPPLDSGIRPIQPASPITCTCRHGVAGGHSNRLDAISGAIAFGVFCRYRLRQRLIRKYTL